MAKKLFKLAAASSIFWDPTQPAGSPDKIVHGQVLEMEETAAVAQAVKSGRLEIADKKELAAYEEKMEVAQAAEALTPSQVAEAKNQLVGEVEKLDTYKSSLLAQEEELKQRDAALTERESGLKSLESGLVKREKEIADREAALVKKEAKQGSAQ